MRIVFIGTVLFSQKALEALIKINANIVGVCAKSKSDFNSDFADLAPISKANNIPYKYIDNINSLENIKWIENLKPDVIFCFGWSSLISKNLINLTPMGIIGFHPTNLPLNRGRHPIIWTLALGLEKTATTFFFMDERADSGDILSQKEILVEYNDDAKTLYQKITNTALIQIEEFVPELENGNYNKIPQNSSSSNTWRKREKSDGLIDFRMSGFSIYNLVRSLTKPYLGAHIVYKGKDMIVWKVEEVINNQKNIESGKVLEVHQGTVLVKTYDGAIRIIEHEFEKIPNIGEYL